MVHSMTFDSISEIAVLKILISQLNQFTIIEQTSTGESPEVRVSNGDYFKSAPWSHDDPIGVFARWIPAFENYAVVGFAGQAFSPLRSQSVFAIFRADFNFIKIYAFEI